MAGLGSSGTTSRLHRVRMNSRRVTRALCVATLHRRRASCDVAGLGLDLGLGAVRRFTIRLEHHIYP